MKQKYTSFKELGQRLKLAEEIRRSKTAIEIQKSVQKKEDRYFITKKPQLTHSPWEDLNDKQKSLLKKLKIEERFKMSKTFKMLEAVQPFIKNESIDKYSKYIEIGEKIFSNFSYLPIRSERNIFHYVHLGFALAKCFKEIQQDEKEDKTAPFFKDPDWIYFHNRLLREYYFDLTKGLRGKIIKETEDVICKIVTVGGVDFGIEINAFSSLAMGERFYISSKFSVERGLEALRELAWSSIKQLSVRYDDRSGAIKIENDVQGNFFPFLLCDEESREIKEFQKKNYGRSILYYGPPGTGKTNLVRGICANLGGRSVKFPELDQINSKNILDVITFLKPNCIVFDDIDRCYADTTSEVLDALEKINQDSNLVFLATANRISDLDDAIIRPGRFDKIKEIKIMEREVLLKIVDNDMELFTLVEKMPVACVKEITKRIEVFGREKALNNIQDIFDRIKNMKMSDYEFGVSDEETG